MIIEYIRQSIFFFKSNITVLAKIHLPFILVINLLLLQVELPAGTVDNPSIDSSLLYISALNLLFIPIYWGATITFMQSTIDGPKYTAGQALIASIGYWPRLFLVFLISSICIILGFMAFILPGIYIAVRLSIADYICVLEKKMPLQSLKLSWQQTEEYIWPILLGIVAILAAIMFTDYLLSTLLNTMFNDNWYLTLGVNILFDFINVLVMIYGFRIYCLIKQELSATDD